MIFNDVKMLNYFTEATSEWSTCQSYITISIALTEVYKTKFKRAFECILDWIHSINIIQS